MVKFSEQKAQESYDEYTSFRARQIESLDELAVDLGADEHAGYYGQIVRSWSDITKYLLSHFNHMPQARIDQMVDILETGEVSGIRIDVDHERHNGIYLYGNYGASTDDINVAYKNRLFYALLAIESPKEFEAITAHDIFALHGTNAVALPGVLAQGGLLSHHEQNKRGLLTGSGEVHPLKLRRQFISFAGIGDAVSESYANSDLRNNRSVQLLASRAREELYEGYALRANEIDLFNTHLKDRIKAGDSFLELADETRFGITLGLTRSALWLAGTEPSIGEIVYVQSDIDEHCFEKTVGTEYLPVVLAPSKHIEAVELLQSDAGYNLEVLSSEKVSGAREDARYVFAKGANPKSKVA